jgi:hypothetical protein
MATLVDRIRDLLLGQPDENNNGNAPAMRITVQCDCGQKIATRIEKAYELQEQYLSTTDKDTPPTVAGYVLKKDLVGSCCHGPVRVTVHFDAEKRLTDHSVEGGQWLSATECA